MDPIVYPYTNPAAATSSAGAISTTGSDLLQGIGTGFALGGVGLSIVDGLFNIHMARDTYEANQEINQIKSDALDAQYKGQKELLGIQEETKKETTAFQMGMQNKSADMAEKYNDSLEKATEARRATQVLEAKKVEKAKTIEYGKITTKGTILSGSIATRRNPFYGHAS